VSIFLSILAGWQLIGPPGGGPRDLLPLRQLAPGVFAVLGDSGKGSEGRCNTGFIVTGAGVVVVDALGSPRQGEELLRTIRSVSRHPLQWLVLTHHHPDHHFGAIVLKRAGARVVAHPDNRVLVAEGGPESMVADWTRVVGAEAMRGFELADRPERPVTESDTLVLGGKRIVVTHPGTAHSAGDVMVWLPADRVLFTGDILVEDGVTMVVDGNSSELLRTLDAIDSLAPTVIVPGHGRIPPDPAALVSRTREYIVGLRTDMRAAVRNGIPLRRATAALPPADGNRPVSLNSRRRRNAVRVYLEEERAYLGLDSTSP
jgi:glyoxylase-like metal-dependent hydrolase (beta-lactamase superfamily II)